MPTLCCGSSSALRGTYFGFNHLCHTSQRCYSDPNSSSKYGCCWNAGICSCGCVGFGPACFHLSLPCSSKGAVTRTSPLATGSAEFGSQDSPCGSELSHGVEAVEQECMVTWHILSPLLFVSCTFHGGKAHVTCSAGRTLRTEYIFL